MGEITQVNRPKYTDAQAKIEGRQMLYTHTYTEKIPLYNQAKQKYTKCICLNYTKITKNLPVEKVKTMLVRILKIRL